MEITHLVVKVKGERRGGGGNSLMEKTCEGILTISAEQFELVKALSLNLSMEFSRFTEKTFI